MNNYYIYYHIYQLFLERYHYNNILLEYYQYILLNYNYNKFHQDKIDNIDLYILFYKFHLRCIYLYIFFCQLLIYNFLDILPFLYNDIDLMNQNNNNIGIFHNNLSHSKCDFDSIQYIYDHLHHLILCIFCKFHSKIYKNYFLNNSLLINWYNNLQNFHNLIHHLT